MYKVSDDTVALLRLSLSSARMALLSVPEDAQSSQIDIASRQLMLMAECLGISPIDLLSSTSPSDGGNGATFGSQTDVKKIYFSEIDAIDESKSTITIPAEVLDCVMSFCQPFALLECALVNRRWSQAATRWIYQAPHFTSISQLFQFMTRSTAEKLSIKKLHIGLDDENEFGYFTLHTSEVLTNLFAKFGSLCKHVDYLYLNASLPAILVQEILKGATNLKKIVYDTCELHLCKSLLDDDDKPISPLALWTDQDVICPKLTSFAIRDSDISDSQTGILDTKLPYLKYVEVCSSNVDIELLTRLLESSVEAAVIYNTAPPYGIDMAISVNQALRKLYLFYSSTMDLTTLHSSSLEVLKLEIPAHDLAESLYLFGYFFPNLKCLNLGKTVFPTLCEGEEGDDDKSILDMLQHESIKQNLKALQIGRMYLFFYAMMFDLSLSFIVSIVCYGERIIEALATLPCLEILVLVHNANRMTCNNCISDFYSSFLKIITAANDTAFPAIKFLCIREVGQVKPGSFGIRLKGAFGPRANQIKFFEDLIPITRRANPRSSEERILDLIDLELIAANHSQYADFGFHNHMVFNPQPFLAERLLATRPVDYGPGRHRCDGCGAFHTEPITFDDDDYFYEDDIDGAVSLDPDLFYHN